MTVTLQKSRTPKDFSFDGADRETTATTGATVSELLGTNNTSDVTTTYTGRGTVGSVGGNHGPLVASITRDADGLIKEIVYGDGAATTTTFSYDNRRRLSHVLTNRGPPMPDIWDNPPTGYLPAPNPDANNQPTFQFELQDDVYEYDIVGNPTTIYDNRDPDEWPAYAKPVDRTATYDDLYRLSSIAYTYEADDTWQSPFHEENTAASTDARRSSNPSPHVSFNRRIRWQTYAYDWLGNTTHTDDDARGFYDRSLGDITNSSTKPYQLESASNESQPAISPEGNLATGYDAAGNLTRLHVRRHGTCLPSGADCNQIYAYDWDEVGRLVQARRWDVTAANLGTPASSLPGTTPDVRLQYAYDAGDERVIKTAIDSGASARYTLYIFDTLELRRAEWVEVDPGPPQVFDYELTKWTEVPYLYANGVRLARVHYDDNSPEIDGEETHVLLELGDHLGSTSVVVERDTGELVERGTYQAYGGGESTYRPARWEHFREDYRFTGKEEDVEVGLTYFGKRFLNPLLQRWLSPDPLSLHEATEADLNLYAYVNGQVLRAIDPLGLDGEERLNNAVAVSDSKIPDGIEYFALAPKGEARSMLAPASRGDQVKWADDLPEHVTIFRVERGGAGMSLEDAKLWAALDQMSHNVADRKQAYNDLADYTEALADAIPALGRMAFVGIEIARAIINANFERDQNEIKEKAAAIRVPPGRGTIYRVRGSGTNSGKPYIGRHNTDDPANNRRSDDGRDRKKAVVIDTYDLNRPEEGRIKEQKHINRAGGLKKTDNARNEIRESKWKEHGIQKPKKRRR